MLQPLDKKNKEFALKQFAHFIGIGSFKLAEPHFLTVMRYTFKEIHSDYDIGDCDRFIADQRRDWTRLQSKLVLSVSQCDWCKIKTNELYSVGKWQYCHRCKEESLE